MNWICVIKEDKTIEWIQLDKKILELEDIYKYADCDTFEPIAIYPGFLAVADEEGRLKQKPITWKFRLPKLAYCLVGQFFICKTEGEEMVTLNDLDKARLTELLAKAEK